MFKSPGSLLEIALIARFARRSRRADDAVTALVEDGVEQIFQERGIKAKTWEASCCYRLT